MHIILFQPQIPQNTGNIVRTCAVTGSSLTLVAPLGFSINDRWLKRAGLDYWEGVEVNVIEDLEALLNNIESNFYFYSSKASMSYNDAAYQSDDYLIFGSETSGLPDYYVDTWPERFLNIPMVSGARCLNLATSVGIVVYEAWRQQSFKT
jgi:tRNA (cytidine/uridine-2'-O-)-methyltransferase